ncbi:MAG: ATP-binding protein [Eubacteriales bacterium]|nr:ATP-binding protein [Eubacteriales bacterium]
MTETKRVRSIARRVNHSFLLRALFLLLLANAMAAGLAFTLHLLTFEKATLGPQWTVKMERELSAGDPANWISTLNSTIYTIVDGTGTEHTLALGAYFRDLGAAVGTGIAVQIPFIILAYVGFRRHTGNLLRPLRTMAATAQELSTIQFDERKYHQLEDAIDSLSVQSPGARISMGNTELMGLETAVNNLIGRMHESYRQQTRFVSDASHELRTPIAVIRGYADLLARWGKDDAQVMAESVEAIQQEADNMQRLVEQLLFLARGDSGRNTFSPAPLDLAALVQEAYEEYLLIDKTHRYRLKADGPLPISGDEAMLKQALRILTDNAAKYSPKDSIITLSCQENGKGEACLSVQDNGAGIPGEDLPHIFERFYRADPARARGQGGGTGLGLAIAKWIVDRHNGYFDVFSREGVGTRITVCLPAKEFKDTPAPAAES